jgi:hypothetical protein
MKTLLVTLSFFLVMNAFAQDVVVFVDGVEVAIPAKYKVVMVPAHWAVKDISRPSYRVRELPTEPVVVEADPCDSDELVISPATCTPAQ